MPPPSVRLVPRGAKGGNQTHLSWISSSVISPPWGMKEGPRSVARCLAREGIAVTRDASSFPPQPLSVAKLVFARTTPPAPGLLAWIRLITKSETHVLKRLVVCFQFTT